ncbi:MAG: N-acetylmuramoyl-L-alanine amidase [Firmicutes bacterium]|nr:N-acetylmuramoyl-L-alanine amidase [Bacillota bacterium]
MRKVKIVVLNKKIVCLTALITFVILFMSVLLFIYLANLPSNIFVDPKSGIIVIDPGHGGIDGGANKDGILEKEINLSISKKLRILLEQKGYKVIMTREEDVSLDSLDNSSRSRHQRDLNARVNIINSSNAQLFLSIHVNCNLKKPTTDGSIVFYSDKFWQNKVLAYCIQRSLNGMIVNGKKRTIHDPQQANFFILSYSNVPGVIVETAFISNTEERKLLTKEEFREEIAKAISNGVERYLNEPGFVFAPNELNKQNDFSSKFYSPILP